MSDLANFLFDSIRSYEFLNKLLHLVNISHSGESLWGEMARSELVETQLVVSMNSDNFTLRDFIAKFGNC